ncbi:hypothetical protein K435DRAFT_562725, partial [Dendrothele bispora CBS 962.96]
KGWYSPIYGFYKKPFVEYVEKRKVHTFACLFCKVKVRRYQDTTDKNSPSGLARHAKACIGEQEVKNAMESGKKPDEVRHMLSGRVGPVKLNCPTFDRVTRWVTENCRPFEIVADRGFQSLMKTGRPHYWIPHPTTVSHDVKKVFAVTRSRISKLLRDYDGDISFATDAWTSPNHMAFVAITAHLIQDGDIYPILLDFFEVPESHTGKALAHEFARVVAEFGISDKV